MTMADDLTRELDDLADTLRDLRDVSCASLELLSGPHARMRVDDACTIQNVGLQNWSALKIQLYVNLHRSAAQIKREFPLTCSKTPRLTMGTWWLP